MTISTMVLGMECDVCMCVILYIYTGALVLVSHLVRDHWYCTHPELPISYENPTTFCQLSG